MSPAFDEIIFLLSTDCFCGELMKSTPEKNIEKIKKTARKVIPEIIQGGDNYYMCSDFSSKRISNTRSFFLERVSIETSKEIAEKIDALYNQFISTSENYTAASYIIGSVASRLYWLASESFVSPITEELLDAVSDIEPLGLESDLHGFEWKQAWLESESEWDKYVMSLMDGIDEMPYLAFIKIKNDHLRLSYLSTWKKNLGEERFLIISDFISTEAHHQLDSLNPNAATEIDRIIKNI